MLRPQCRDVASAMLLVAEASLIGCSEDNSGQPMDDLSAPLDLVPLPPDTGGVASGIGDPCIGNGGLDQGTCADGQNCIPAGAFGYVDGYCTADCTATPCPDDAA